MSENDTVRYRPGIDPKPASKTDWKRVDAMTDDEVETLALTDPDNLPLSPEQLAGAFRPARLRALRERLGLSQGGFAERFGINVRTLQDWEQGRRAPDQVARSYLAVIEKEPEAAARAIAAE